MDNLEHRLVRCFSSVLPALNEEQIRNASVESVPDWHSLASVTLISVVQEEFGVQVGSRICLIWCPFRRYRTMSSTMSHLERPDVVEEPQNLAAGAALREPYKEVKENLLAGVCNRICQHLARILPGARSLRVGLHRWRGVNIGKGVWIVYDVILDTSRPHLIVIEDGASLSMRVTAIAHFQA